MKIKCWLCKYRKICNKNLKITWCQLCPARCGRHKGISNEEVYTEVLYVHPDGDNTDGKTWNTAFTNLEDAIKTAGSDPEDNTLIVRG